METQHQSVNREISADTAIRRLIDANIIGILECDITGKIYSANEAFLNIVGYTRPELDAGLVRWDLITPPEYRHTDEEAIRQLRETGRAQPWEKAYIHKKGHLVPIYVGVAALDDVGHRCLAFVIDLTIRKTAESQLKESEERFRAVAEAIPNMVFTADTTGKVDYANRWFYEATGTDPADDDGFLWKRMLHPDDLKRILDSQLLTAREGRRFEMEGRYRMADGTYRWHLIRAIPIPYGQGGAVKYFATSTDIDDQKRAEQELRESELRFRTLAEAIPQIVWIADPEGCITFFNSRWFEYTGLSVEQSLDGGWELLIHSDDRDRYFRQWKRAVETGDTFEIEFRLKRAVGLGGTASGAYRWQLGRAVASRSQSGTIVEWFGTWTDIEDQRKVRIGR